MLSLIIKDLTHVNQHQILLYSLSTKKTVCQSHSVSPSLPAFHSAMTGDTANDGGSVRTGPRPEAQLNLHLT